MKLQLRYFASIREAIGRGSESAECRAETVGALRDELIARGGAYADALARGRSLRIAVDQEMCEHESAVLREGAEVAFFPPVTGG